MASEAQRLLLAVLPTDIQLAAVDLIDHAGVAEYCFPLAMSARVLHCLIESGKIPLGGDIWKADDDGYSFGDDGWFVNNDSVAGRIELVLSRAMDCFARYEGTPGVFATFIV